MKATWRKKTIKGFKFPKPIEPELLAFWKYCEQIRILKPEIWNLGNATLGKYIYQELSNIVIRGCYIEQDKFVIQKWQSMMQLHKKDKSIEGIVSNMKWLNIVEKGFEFMKKKIELHPNYA